MAEIGQLSWW